MVLQTKLANHPTRPYRTPSHVDHLSNKQCEKGKCQEQVDKKIELE